MTSGLSFRMIRCFRSSESELSCYRHGSDPPKTKKYSDNCDSDSNPHYPAITHRLNAFHKEGLLGDPQIGKTPLVWAKPEYLAEQFH